ncbi:MAG: patatin-like phospholipase family protein [Clostridia bacterium]|nr:patatin-like phospholipase family protein [Clostridia bacterium]
MYGVVFAGGGIRGAYEIGVWKALQEMEIEIGAVAGCSIGSVNGALFAAHEFEKAEKIWKSLTPDKVLDMNFSGEKLISVKNIPAIIDEVKKKKGVGMNAFRELLKENIDEDKIRKSDIEFGLVTFSLSDNKLLEIPVSDIPEGELVDYLMASSSLPGMAPFAIGDKKFLDGGVMDNKPFGMLVNKGFTDIISVDVGGIGMVKKSPRSGINIIDIKCSSPLVGILDFNNALINETIEMGYFDTKRAFGKVMGDIYPIRAKEYLRAREKYSKELIKGLETAAEILSVNKYKEYSVVSLARETVLAYKKILKTSKSEIIEKLSFGPILFSQVTSSVKNGKIEGYHKAAATVLKKYASAVNALCYFIDKF